jgi:uncharacterized protein (TIGR02246 family)
MRTLIALFGPLLACVCFCLAAEDEPKAVTPAQATKPSNVATLATQAAPATRTEQLALEQAITAQVDSFIRAFNAADAQAVAGLFTPDARVIDEQGRVVAGRDAIAALFASSFDANPGAKIALTTESLRLLAPDVALEEGRARVAPVGSGQQEITRYTVIYVKRDGTWLQSSVHERSDKEVSHHDRLQELEWMVGDWVDESEEAVIFTTCRWSENKNFLLREFDIHIKGELAMSGTQRIGWDPLHKQFRSWVFDSEGGFGEGFWSRSGNQWIVKATGVLRDGRTASSSHIVTPVNKDMMRWKAVERTEGGHAIPDMEEYVIVRKPPKPQSTK